MSYIYTWLDLQDFSRLTHNPTHMFIYRYVMYNWTYTISTILTCLWVRNVPVFLCIITITIKYVYILIYRCDYSRGRMARTKDWRLRNNPFIPFSSAPIFFIFYTVTMIILSHWEYQWIYVPSIQRSRGERYVFIETLTRHYYNILLLLLQ